MQYTIKQRLGAVIIDAPKYLFFRLRSALKWKTDYLRICNRDENILLEGKTGGVACQWQWTSNLYLPKLYPWFGQQLLKTSIKHNPIILKSKPMSSSVKADISFIIGHRGDERLALLLKTIESIAGQTNCAVECIVVEQDKKPLTKEKLPPWVTYVFSKNSGPFSRSAAFNTGAIHAKSENLIFHDNDMLASHNYASEALKLLQQGFDFLDLKRFIFYLDKASTAKQVNSRHINSVSSIDYIMQNNIGASTVAHRRAFKSIGGFDERFVGWGSEDNEFWERANTKKVWDYGFISMLHLWHAPQAEKHSSSEATNKRLFETLSARSPEKRIKELLNQSSEQESRSNSGVSLSAD